MHKFSTIGQFKDELFRIYDTIADEKGLDTPIGREAVRLKGWFDQVFQMLDLPMEEFLLKDAKLVQI